MEIDYDMFVFAQGTTYVNKVFLDPTVGSISKLLCCLSSGTRTTSSLNDKMQIEN